MKKGDNNLMQNFLKPSTWLLSMLLLLPAPTLWAKTVEYDGLIEPYRTVEIGAPTQGIVSRIKVERSDSVKKGQLLVGIESSVEWVSVEKAKVISGFEGEIGLQKTQLAFAKRDYNRIKQVASIPTRDKDQAATDIILTQHRLDKAREKKSLAQMELKKTRALLGRHTIRSPLNGVVVEIYVNPGEYVNTQPLLRIAQIDPLRVEVIVPAQLFGKITPGMEAKIIPELPAYGEQVATVTIVDRVIDSASSTFGVRLELPNDELKMPSGLKCQVQFEIDEEDDKKDNKDDK